MNRNVRKIAFVAAILAVAALAVLPPTSVLFRQQVRWGLSGQWSRLLVPRAFAGNEVECRAIARRYPNDFPVQLAAAIGDGDTAAYSSKKPDLALLLNLNELQDRFPQQPAVLAALLRYASRGSLGRAADWGVLDQHRKAVPVPPRKVPTYWEANPDFLDALARTAQEGQRLDPDNGFFRYLLACIRLGQHRDEDARRELHRAARCSHWNDYRTEEVEGQIRLQTARYGELPSLVRANIVGSQYSPEMQLIADAGRIFAGLAVKQEEQGDRDGGVALRRDLARVGALLRRDGTTVYAGVNGGYLVADASARPGGESPLKWTTPGYAQLSNEQKSRLAEERYVRYLNRTGYADEARWYTDERARERAQSALVKRGFAENVITLRSVMWETAWLIVSYVLLANVLWVLIAGGIAHAAARGARVRDAAPMHPSVRRGVWSIVFLPFWAGAFAYYGSQMHGMSGPNLVIFALVGVIIGLALPLPLLCRSRPELKRNLALYGKTVAVGLPVLAVAIVTQPAALAGPFLVSQCVVLWRAGSIATNPSSGAALLIATVCFAASAGLVLTVARSMYRSLRRKTPVSVGLALDLRRVSVPLATGLLIAYGGALVTTAAWEARATRDLSASIQHEGRFYARQAGMQWPDLVPDTDTKGGRP